MHKNRFAAIGFLAFIIVMLPFAGLSMDAEAAEEVTYEDTGVWFDETVEDYPVRLAVTEGALPEDMQVSVNKVNSVTSECLLAENVISEKLAKNDSIEAIATFKITFRSQGEIAVPEKTVRACIGLSENMQFLMETLVDAEVRIYHISDEVVEAIGFEMTEEEVSFEISEGACYSLLVIGHREFITGSVNLLDEEIDTTEGIIADDTRNLNMASSGDVKYISPYVTAAKDQNPYGTCWAFATVSAVEAYMYKTYGMQYLDLSELQLAYSTYHTKVDPLKGISEDTVSGATSNFLNGGGSAKWAGLTLMTWNGPVHETSVPYGNAASLQIANSLSSSKVLEKTVRVTDMYMVNLQDDRKGVKNLIVKNGAVAIAYCDEDMYYNATYNSYYHAYSDSTNHVVAIVGWDDHFPRNHFNYEAPGNGAWYVRNSWSTAGGQNHCSYFWMSYYDNALYNTGYAFKAVDAASYDNNYQYDGSLDTCYIQEYGSSPAVIANVFKAKANESGETLKAVSFYTQDVGVEYKIEIYTDLKDPNNPESGTLMSKATTKGSRTYAGYHTVTLKKPVSLTYGKKFSVVITLSKDGRPARYGLDTSYQSGSINIECGAKSGQSFRKRYGTWYDAGQTYDENIRIKAYTVNGKASGEITYNIKFSANGGKGSMDPMTGLTTSKKTTLSANKFSRKGYIFEGWNTKKDGSGKSYSNKQKVSRLTDVDGKTVVLYAQWTKRCRITYELNGGKNNSKNPTSFKIKSSGKVKLYEPTRSGYEFAGWYTSKDFKKSSKVTSLKKNATKHVTLYAKWVAKSYSIKFIGNGATNGTMDSLTNLKSGQSVTLPYNRYYRSGYTFIGWSTSKKASDIKYYNAETLARGIKAKSGRTVKLYAIWSPTSNDKFYCYGGSLVKIANSAGISWTSFYSSAYRGDIQFKVFDKSVVQVSQDVYWGKYGSNRRDLNFSPKKKGRTLIKVTAQGSNTPIYIFYISEYDPNGSGQSTSDGEMNVDEEGNILK